MRDLDDTTPDVRLTIERLRTIGADRVLALLRARRTTRASGMFSGVLPTATADAVPVASIYDMADGKISRIRIFLDRDEALEAAGLREEARLPLWTKSDSGEETDTSERGCDRGKLVLFQIFVFFLGLGVGATCWAPTRRFGEPSGNLRNPPSGGAGDTGARSRGRPSCEHVFVTSQGSAYSQFKRALSRGNFLLAWTLAADLPRVPLADALALLLQARDQQPWRFETAAPRWHARLCSEARLTLAEAHLALAALHMLRGPSAAAGGKALAAICQTHRLDDAIGVLDDWLHAQQREP